MNSRLRALLSWQLRFQSRRMSTWVIGAAYLLLVLFQLMASSNAAGVATPGLIPFHFIKGIHALAAVILAVRLAGRSMEDHASGTLGLLKIASFEPGTWVTFRFAAMVLGYLPIWVLRVPIYTLILSLGGVQLEDVVWLEAVQWVAFLVVGCLALLLARYSTTGMGLAAATILVASFWQMILYFPLIVAAAIELFRDRPSGGELHSWAVTMGKLALPQYFLRLPSGLGEWTMALTSLGLHLGLALLLLRMLRRVVYFNVGTETATLDAAGTMAERRSATRPSRRVSDDPLAWQVRHVHSGRVQQGRTGAVVGAIVVLAIAFGAFREAVPQSLVLGLACGFTVLILAFKPSECLTLEVKGKTLSTLALLPLDGREIYEGWLRGARHLARPLYVAVAIGGMLLTFLAPHAGPYVWMVLAFAVLLLPEAAFLSNLMANAKTPLFVQLFLSLWTVFLIAVIVAISVLIAFSFSSWLALMAFAGLSLAIRPLLVENFAEHMADRVECEP